MNLPNETLQYVLEGDPVQGTLTPGVADGPVNVELEKVHANTLALRDFLTPERTTDEMVAFFALNQTFLSEGLITASAYKNSDRIDGSGWGKWEATEDSSLVDDGGTILHIIDDWYFKAADLVEVNPRLFGAKFSPSTLSDDYSAIQGALSTGKDVVLDDSFYVDTQELTAPEFASLKPVDFQKIIFKNGARCFHGKNGSTGNEYAPAFFVNGLIGVRFVDPKFTHLGDFTQDDGYGTGKFGLNIISRHFQAHIFVHSSDKIVIDGFDCTSDTDNNTINFGIYSGSSGVLVRSPQFDNVCVGLFGEGVTTSIEQPYIAVHSTKMCRQSQKSFITYGPSHTFYINGHPRPMIDGVEDRGEILAYDQTLPRWDAASWTGHEDGHTVKVVGVDDGWVRGVISNREQGILDVTNTSENFTYNDLVWSIGDYSGDWTQDLSWAALRIDEGAGGPIRGKCNISMFAGAGDFRFVFARCESAKHDILIEHYPTAVGDDPVLTLNDADNSTFDVIYNNKGGASNAKPLVRLIKGCTLNTINFDIKNTGGRNYGGACEIHIEGSNVPSANVVSLKKVPYIISTRMTSYDTTSGSPVARTTTEAQQDWQKNLLLCGETGDLYHVLFENQWSSGSAFVSTYYLPTLYNTSGNAFDGMFMAADAGNARGFVQDLAIRKIGNSVASPGIAHVENRGGFVISGTVLGFTQTTGAADIVIGDTFTLGGLTGKIRKVTVSSGSFSGGNAVGEFDVEYYNASIASSGTMTFSGKSTETSITSKATKFSEGIVADIDIDGNLVVSSNGTRTSALTYKFSLILKNFINTRF